MRFVRYGVLKPVKQRGYLANPGPDVALHRPPTACGLYVFPAGFVDMFYVPYGDTDDNQRVIRPRDAHGNLIPWEMCCQESVGKGRADQECLTELGRKILKRYDARKDQMRSGSSKRSYVRVMNDPARPPRLLPSGRLDQHLPLLLNKHGEPILAEELFGARHWTLDDYRWNKKGMHWRYVQREDVRDDLEGLDLKEDLDTNKMLRRLCVWPAPGMVEQGLVLMKRPHVFDYNGHVWHHLGDYLRAGELMGVYQNVWFRSDMRSFTKAFRRYLGYESHNLGGGMSASFHKSMWRRVESFKNAPIKNVRGPEYRSLGRLEVYIDGNDFRMASRHR